MDIKVGEYVRTPEEGFIGKLVEINKGVPNYYKIDVSREIRRPDGYSDNYIYSRDGFGLKHSKNIIDLIEVGDILSFEDGSVTRIIEIEKPYFLLKDYGGEQYYEKEEWIAEAKSILTHEMYKSNCYRLED